MPTFPISPSAVSFHFLLFLLPVLRPASAVSNETLTAASTNFDPQIAVLGDATIVDSGFRIQLADPRPSSSGLLLYKSPSRFASFSAEFEFSLAGNGAGISFVMSPFNFASEFLGLDPIDFSIKKGYVRISFVPLVGNNAAHSDSAFVSVTVNAGSSAYFVAKNGEKLKFWIDYDSVSNRLEVRVGELGDRRRPHDPVIANSIDLSKMWQNKEVFVGLGSRNGINTSEICNVYSMKFRSRRVPNWMHSIPVDPKVLKGENVHRRKVCPMTVLAGMIFATGCGALMAFVVLFVWAIFVNRHAVFPIERDFPPVDFKYEKIQIIVEQDEKPLKK